MGESLIHELGPRGRKRRRERRRNKEKGTFSAVGHPLLLFMLIFFMEMRVMLSFSPLAVEQLGVGRKHGYRREEQGWAG